MTTYHFNGKSDGTEGSIQYLEIPSGVAFIDVDMQGAQGGRGGGQRFDGAISWGGLPARMTVTFDVREFGVDVTQLALVVGGSPQSPSNAWLLQAWPDGGPAVPSEVIDNDLRPSAGGGGASTSLWTADANGDLLELLAIAGGGGGGHPFGPNILIAGGGGGGGRFPAGGGGVRGESTVSGWISIAGDHGESTPTALGGKLWQGGRGASFGWPYDYGSSGSDGGNGGDAATLLQPGSPGGGSCGGTVDTSTCQTTIGGRPGTDTERGLGGSTTQTTDVTRSVGAGGGGASWVDTSHAAYQTTRGVGPGLANRSDPLAPSYHGRAVVVFLTEDEGHSVGLMHVSSFDATDDKNFEWSYFDAFLGSDSQTAYQLQIERVVDEVSIVDTGKVVSSASFHTVAGGTLANGITYRWRVRTWNATDSASAYSSWGAFIPGAKPTVTIDSPTASALVASQDFTATWTYAHTGGEPQAAYQLVLERLESTVVVESWDTGKITGSAGSYDFTDVAEGESYRLKVTVWNVPGQESTTATVDFNTNYNAPMTPFASVVSSADDAQNTVYITNPTPTAGEPEVVVNRVYRRAAGETVWTRLSDDALGVFIDIGIASGVAYTYRVVAMAADGRGANSSTPTRTVRFLGVWLHYLATKSGKRNFFYGTGRTEEFDPNITTVKPVGRNFPASEAGVLRSEAVTANVQVMGTEFEHLQRFANAKELVMYRDNRGNKILGMLTIAGWNEQPWGYEVTLRAEAVSGATEEV